jgi:hypothetical protein
MPTKVKHLDVGGFNSDWQLPENYPSNYTVWKDGTWWKSNAVIPGGTPFVWGTSGATWSPLSTVSISLAALFPSSVTTRANVTGWTIPILAGKKYLLEIVGTYQSAAVGTGGSLGFVLASGAVTPVHGFVEMAIANTAVATGLKGTIHTINTTNTTANSFMTSTGVGVINSPHSLNATVRFTCTTTGVMNVQWASETTSSAQINADSTLFVTILN